MKCIHVFTFVSTMFVLNVRCAKILGVFPVPSISHQKPFLAVAKELSLRGHEVTVVTPNPMKNYTLTNLTEIDISFVYNILKGNSYTDQFSSKYSLMKVMFNLKTAHEVLADRILKTQALQDLIKSSVQYDLVLVEAHAFAFYAFGAKFNVPIVAICSLGLLLDNHDFMGNPSHPFLSSEIFSQSPGSAKASFIERFQGLYYSVWYRLACHWNFLPRVDAIVRKYFGNNLPYLGDIASQTSLALTTSNPFVDTVRPNVPTVITVEQMHLEERKPLPKDLKDFIESCPNGTVYFSLGTNVLMNNLGNDTLKVIFEALGDLPYNVIMKFEKYNLYGKPKNVLLREWLPQQDLLGHPNLRVFITQGGLQSIEEAINRGVPMVAIPLAMDQPKNVKKIVEWKMALKMDYSTVTSELLKESITEVATNPSFKQNVLKYKAIIEDQPLKGVNKAVWWIEYVLRHNGTKHLRYPGADVPLYKYFMLNVILFVSFIFVLCVYVVYKSLQLIGYIIVYKKSKTD